MMKTHGIDILHSFTLPGFSWRAALKYTGQRLELISDRKMYDFIQKAMRGGISTITTRYAKANNPYIGAIRGKTSTEIMKELERQTNEEQQFSIESVCKYFPDFSKQEIMDLRLKMKNGKVFNPNETTIYIMYLDANNLYGWAMSQPLPVGVFEWMSEAELDLPIKEMATCFIEVDLEYPRELHDKFSELVPAPDKIVPDRSKVEKLALNVLPKKNYVCHIENLKMYVNELGMELVKVHAGIKFEPKVWLKSYIDLNTKLRMESTNEADKEMFKLLNNVVFGKTCENLFNRTNYALVTTRIGNGGKKCKGIKKSIIKKKLSIEDFKDCVLGRTQKTVEQMNFGSYKHEIYTERMRKAALSPYDD